MIVVGLNLGSTEFKKELHDGGVCIIVDGKIALAIGEERISRKKRAGGFKESIEYALNCLNLEPNDVDLVVYSSCCEQIQSISEIEGLSSKRLIPCNHHYSHALSVYLTSPFNEAIVIVLDAGGNIISNENGPHWWLFPREQQSYYLAKGNKVTLLERDCEKPECAGIGELYRAFTYYLGWNSSRHAGKTMALAAYGDPNRFKEKAIFNFDAEGHIGSFVKNNPMSPLQVVNELLARYNILGIKPRLKNCTIHQDHKDLACWIQRETERILTLKVNHLIEKTGVKNICIAGGVAYNCAAIGKLVTDSSASNIFVHPASGDQGQCLGNAMYGFTKAQKSWPRFYPFSPFLGCEENITFSKIADVIREKKDLVEIEENQNIAMKGAELLAKGNFIGWFQGRSEFGPRALGNRSILANPLSKDTKTKLNKIKGREDFMPFAPTILFDKISDYYPGIGDSPFMTTAFKMHSASADKVPAAVHNDGTSRVQTLREEFNPLFYNLISKFNDITHVPLVINTSFNGAGEPIVDSLEDAFRTFIKLDLDYLILGNYLLRKRSKFIQSEEHQEVIFSLLFDNEDINESQVANRLRHVLPNSKLISRQKFLLFEEFIDWVKSGRKTTTIRYNKLGVDFPSKTIMPLLPTSDYSSNPSSAAVALVQVSKFIVKKFGNLTDQDAHNDGFSCIGELIKTLHDIYGEIKPDEYISIYTIKIVQQQ